MLARLIVPLDVDNFEICGIEYVILECQYVPIQTPSCATSARLGKLIRNPHISAEDIDKYYDTKAVRHMVGLGKSICILSDKVRKQSSDSTGKSISNLSKKYDYYE